MKIAALQMVSTPDVPRNLDAARALIAQAADAGARLVALPEYFCLMGRADGDKLGVAEADGDAGPIQRSLGDAARRHGVWVIGGTLPLRTADPARVRRSDPGDPGKCPVWQLHEVYSSEDTRTWVDQGCRSAAIGTVGTPRASPRMKKPCALICGSSSWLGLATSNSAL
jgi:predicted amidohydrolase